MQKYVAFLRAINVGGTSIIKMDALRRYFESFGLDNVQTYIQTGNVIFESNEKDSAGLEKKLEAHLEQALGYHMAIFLRTLDDVKAAAEKPPFEPQDGETVHVVFLHGKPGTRVGKDLAAHNSRADEFAVRGREVYNLRHVRDASVFSNQFIEKVLGVPATTRNLTTVRKIAAKYG